MINKLIPIRMSAHEELVGADFLEHDVRQSGVGVSRAVSVLAHFHPTEVDTTIRPNAANQGDFEK